MYFFNKKFAVVKQFSHDFEMDLGPISEEFFSETFSIGFAYERGCFKNTGNIVLIKLLAQSIVCILLSLSSQNQVFHFLST